MSGNTSLRRASTCNQHKCIARSEKWAETQSRRKYLYSFFWHIEENIPSCLFFVHNRKGNKILIRNFWSLQSSPGCLRYLSQDLSLQAPFINKERSCRTDRIPKEEQQKSTSLSSLCSICCWHGIHIHSSTEKQCHLQVPLQQIALYSLGTSGKSLRKMKLLEKELESGL